MKKIISLILLITFCLGVGRFWYWATDGFRLSRIEGFSKFGIGSEREFSREAEAALSQRYYYLGRGRQCFAFQSEDGHYVLKFPRLDRYNERLWFRLPLADSYLTRRIENHTSRKEKLFSSFEISFEELRTETALLAMFNSPKNGRKIEIVDRLGRIVKLPLEKTGFILQRKLPLFRDVFQKAEVESLLDQLLEVVVQIAEKGILTKDGSFLKNFGFDGTRAYQIDVGSFYRRTDLTSSQLYEASIHSNIETLRVWLLQLDPSYLTLIDRKLVPIYERGNAL